jgi:hypothetical protein
MSPFLKEHLFGALVIGFAFGTAIGISVFASPSGPIPQHASRWFVTVTAIILVKLLFDTGTLRNRMVLWTAHLQGHPALMRCHYPIV